MRQSEVKKYNDDNELYEQHLDGRAIFPCSTPNLYYNAMESVYEPTSLGLAKYGINMRRMTSSDSQDLDAFNKKISRQFYEYLMNVNGADIEKIRYMIAKSISPNIIDKLTNRQTIEKALYSQADYYIRIGDKQTYENKLNISNITHNYLASLGVLYAADTHVMGFNPHDKRSW